MQIIESRTVTMSSREIAELTEKRHDHVIRDIRVMIDELKDSPGLGDQYQAEQDARGYTACFHLDRELTETLLTGYSIPLRRRVIARLHELETAQAAPSFQVPTTLSGALRLAAEQAEQIEQQQILIEQQKPAVQFVNNYVQADGLMGFRQVAKLLQANERKFKQMLIDKGIFYHLGGVMTPKAQHIDAGRFEVKTGTGPNDHAFTQAKFTPKGVQWIAGLWIAETLNG